jgi:hypothetical protein
MQGTFPEVLDSSILATFKSCPQLFKKIYVDQWKSKERSVHLHAGGAFAHGVERSRRAFYEEGQPAEDAVAEGLQALLTFYGNFECPPDSAKSAQRMAGALEFYFERYPLVNGDQDPITLPGGKRGIEFNFVHPLEVNHPVTGNPLLYCGRMDAILNFAETIFKCDEKTTTSLGPSWSRQWDLRSQFIGYEWGCRKSGIRTAGIIVRGVSILKTKYDTQQAIVYHPDWIVDRWYNELYDWIAQMIRCWETGKWVYNLDHSCADYGGCGFLRACTAQDEQPWLETYFERRHWDPITRIETKL